MTKAKIPFLILLVMTMSLAAGFLPIQLFGFNVSGLGWFLPMLVAFYILSLNLRKAYFPIVIWAPWVALLVAHLILLNWSWLDPRVNPLQRTLQVLSPLAVGIAISTFKITPSTLDHLNKALRVLLYLVFFLVFFGQLQAIMAGDITGLAAQAMTAIFLGVFFITRFFIYGKWHDGFSFVLMCLVPIFAVTRSATLVIFFSAILTLARVSMKTRLLMGTLGVGAALSVFSLDRFQSKFFFSGQGSITDISLDNPDFATSGRGFLWDLLFERAMQHPWLGHGTGYGETFTYQISPVGYPHNDWLLTFLDYGVLGVAVFAWVNVAMLYQCIKHAKQALSPQTKLFLTAGASMYIPFMMIMYTDNIMVYASFFGLLHYMVIGAGFAAYRYERSHANQVHEYQPLTQNQTVAMRRFR